MLDIPVLEDMLLQECPRCRYGLRGLPIEHSCPECGLPFDRRWKILAGPTSPYWKRRRTQVLRWVYGGGAFLGAVVIVIFVLTEAMPSGSGWLLWAVMAAGLAAFGRHLLRVPKSIVAIGPSGLFLHFGNETHCYEWARVGEARGAGLRGRIYIPVDDDHLVLDADEFCFGNSVAAKTFVRAINEYPRPAAPVSDRNIV